MEIETNGSIALDPYARMERRPVLTMDYKLPSSGSCGTYLFTISGVAILATALLLVMDDKRKEGRARRAK